MDKLITVKELSETEVLFQFSLAEIGKINTSEHLTGMILNRLADAFVKKYGEGILERVSTRLTDEKLLKIASKAMTEDLTVQVKSRFCDHY